MLAFLLLWLFTFEVLPQKCIVTLCLLLKTRKQLVFKIVKSLYYHSLTYFVLNLFKDSCLKLFISDSTVFELKKCKLVAVLHKRFEFSVVNFAFRTVFGQRINKIVTDFLQNTLVFYCSQIVQNLHIILFLGFQNLPGLSDNHLPLVFYLLPQSNNFR